MLKKTAHILTKYRKLSFILVSVLLLITILFFRNITINGELEGFYMEDNPYSESYRKISQFSPFKHAIQIQVKPNDCTIKELIDDLSKMDSLLSLTFQNSETYSIHTAGKFIMQRISGDSLAIKALPLIKDIPVLGNLISDNEKYVLVIFHIKSFENFDLEKFNNIISGGFSSFGEPAVMSTPHLEAEMVRSIKDDLLKLSVAIMLFISILILAIYRDFRSLLVILINTLYCVIPLLLIFHLLKIQLNIITLISFPVVLILSLADSVHLVNAYNHSSSEENKFPKIERLIARFLIPCFLTSLTTAIAFISFTLNDVVYIREFGRLVSVGVLLEFLLTFLTLPLLMTLLRVRSATGRTTLQMIDKMMSYKKTGSIILIGMLIFSIFLVPRLRFNTDYDAFYPVNSKLRKDNAAIENNFHSLLGLDILISKNPEKAARENIKQTTIDIVRELDTLPGVKKISSLKDRIDFQRKYMYGMYRSELRNMDKLYLNDSSSKIHVSVLDPQDIKHINKSFEEIAGKYRDQYDIVSFSPAMLLDYINESVARSLFRSLLFSLFFLVLVFVLLTRNFRNAFISTLANLVPMGILIIAFVLFRIDINIGTSITAVICLGLIVDDSIHILYCRVILKRRLGNLSLGLLTTTLLLAGGFLLFVLSNIKPTRIFGALSALVFVVTFVSDIFILDWLLKFKKSGTKEQELEEDQS